MLRETDLLLIVDLQVDFCPGGALAVAGGDGIIPVVNRLARIAPHVVLTQDWHPAEHRSFASRHPGHAPFDGIAMPYGAQTLWPDHCVQGSPGAALHPDLDATNAELILRKGVRAEIDSYSAFFENDRVTPTGLAGYLRERGMRRIFLCGLATDFCVGFSALDAAAQGFEAVLVEDACKAIDLDGSLDAMMLRLNEAGIAKTVSTALAC